MECEKNETINLQVFYYLCKDIIYKYADTLGKSLEYINIIPSWVNTIDDLDTSLIIFDTLKIIEDLKSNQNISYYISIITQITIILNNIFYSSNRSYKKFWKDNTILLYNNLIYPLTLEKKDLEQYDSSIQIDIETYYKEYFNRFQDKCIRLGLTVDLEEFIL